MKITTLLPEIGPEQRAMLLRELLALLPDPANLKTAQENGYWYGYNDCRAQTIKALTEYLEE